MKKTGNKGFTLVELLIAISIGSIVMLGVFALFNAQSRMKKTHEQVVEAQQNIRSAMYLLERELRMAGYKGNTTNSGTTLGFIPPCDATTMTFTYLTDTDPTDKDGDGITDESVLTTIQYTLVDGNIERTVDGTKITIAENIDDLEFYYTRVDSSNTITQETAPAIENLKQIRSVTVSILAKSRKPVNVSTSGHAFASASGEDWKALNDNFIRRYAQTSVICRNL